ncbi:sugar phosphate isomerase/epimerase and 4-hydroxyphenylpyruvate domain-containing protein [Streptomyces spinosisporus]|uniref:3-dehydroshikimate dehydratase n=1 Tax=Streptomyces spinosisporus TaxID=2927582 RepID=A0ABS9X9V6_9ACTN|nr:sugar phosphate isomerase/epimerase and 4-hydroxyphenylpyruvate domain-containing protein [Streptomyces spinosisporus]MCI3238765.1 TIM barrel protein [Streptomyces spinosisporus]
MRTAIATVSLSGTLTEKLTAASRAGFDGVEIFENDLLASRLAPEEVRERCADLGLSIDLYQPMRDMEAVPEEEFSRNLRRARRKFEVMRRLGADTVLVCSSVHAAAVDDDELAARQLSQLADLAQEFGIRVAYEALAWGRHVSTYDHAWRIVEAADHPALGTCLDSFHILSRGSDPKAIADIPGEKIFFLQLADAPLLAMDVLQWSWHYRCFPGQGGFDVAGLVRHVLRAGYDGPLSLEVFNDVFRQAEAGPAAVDAHRSLLVLQESLGSVELPGPVVPTGVAFAELVTPDAEPVSEVLGALGFARTARHRSKPVDLWEQGEARVLVNTGPAVRREGTGLAAIGLESPDPAGAARRAEALLSPVLPRRRATTDAPLDAVAAPDGTELFFCATGRPELPDWRGDFEDVVHTATTPGVHAASGYGAHPATAPGAHVATGSGVPAATGRGARDVTGLGTQDAPGLGAYTATEPGACAPKQPGAHARTTPGGQAASEPDAQDTPAPDAHTATTPGVHTATEPGAPAATRPRAHTAPKPDAQDTTAPGAQNTTAPDAHTAPTPHVTRIDHLALVQPWHQFDEAALFHRSVLGLSAQESVDVADPYGLLRSRAVANGDGSVRIVLSVGAAPRDDTVHAQHIALATDDVVAAARRFLAAGGRLLPIPANYYDDLAARFEFADGELETYRELGILYDRDAHGEFRHCYTRTVGRVFFELVQRDGGHRGYGAQNAPVRLAAQHLTGG